MKLLRVGAAGHESPCVLADDGAVLDLTPLTKDIDGAFLETRLDDVRDALSRGTLDPLRATNHRIGPPLSHAGKIVCVGLNYADHAAETGAPSPPEPILFLKTPDTVVGPTDTVLVPRASTHTDYEVELAIVIGRTARYLASPAHSGDVIAGYAISNDVSEREYQLFRGGQWDKGKNCETFNPFGPWLVTADEIDDPQELGLRLWVNDELRQNSNTGNMIFGVNHLVWYISQFIVLRPGDIINTGTPGGVAMSRSDGDYLQAGDALRLEIDGLGVQETTMGAA